MSLTRVAALRVLMALAALAGCQPDPGLDGPAALQAALGEESAVSITWNSPAEGQLLGASIPISVTPSAAAGIARVEIYIDPVVQPVPAPTWSLRWAVITSPPYETNLSVTATLQGPQILRAVAVDTLGATATATRPITIDVLPPNAVIFDGFTPMENSTISERVRLSVTGFDAHSGMKRFEVYDGTTLIGQGPANPPGTAGFFTFEWVLLGVSPGLHTLTARGFDRAENMAVSAPRNLNVRVDASPPMVTINSPADGTVAAPGPLNFVVSSSDDVAVSKLELFDGSQLVATQTSPPGVASFFHFLQPSATGTHTFTVRASDAAGNATISAPVRLTVLPPLPHASFFLVPSGATPLSGNVIVTATPYAPGGIASVKFFIDDVLIATDVSDPYMTTWDTKTFAFGPHVVRVLVVDTFGRTAESSMAVTVDNRPALVNVAFRSMSTDGLTDLGPIPPENLHGLVKVVASTATEPGLKSVAFSLDRRATWQSVDQSPFEMLWDTTAAVDGPHPIYLDAVDRLHNVQNLSIETIVSNEVAVTIDTPVAGALVGKSVVITAHTANDSLVGPEGLAFYDGSTLIGHATTPPFQMTWTPRTSGSHALTARVSIWNHLNTSPAVIVSVDIDAPTVTITSPVAGPVDPQVLQISADVTDNGAIEKVEFFDGTTLIETKTQAPYSLAWNAAATALGNHTLVARAIDTAGNVADSLPVLVTVRQPDDTSAPTVSITAPSNRAVVSGIVTLRAVAADNVGVTRVSFFDGNALVGTVTDAPHSFAWDTRRVPGGNHRLTSRAFDAAGNSAASSVVNVFIDNTLPSVSLNPPGRIRASATAMLAARATDNVSVARVDFLVGDVVVCSDATAPYRCAWNVPSEIGKRHLLQARAFDTAGSARSSAVVTVTAR